LGGIESVVSATVAFSVGRPRAVKRGPMAPSTPWQAWILWGKRLMALVGLVEPGLSKYVRVESMSLEGLQFFLHQIHLPMPYEF